MKTVPIRKTDPKFRRPPFLSLPCLVLLVLAACAAPLRALDPRHSPSQYGYREWNKTDGLPYTAVRGLFQTRDGYLWLATRAGFSRFDGVTFTNFAPSALGHGADADDVTFFAEDSRHRLWIGTRLGVYWYENGRLARAALGPALDRAEITGLLPDGDGMYVAIPAGVLRWENGTLAPVDLGRRIQSNWNYESLRRTRNGDIVVVANNLIRLGADGSRAYFDRETLIPGSQNIRALAEDRSGGLWLGTSVGLFLWKDGRLERFPENNGFAIDIVRSLCTDRDDNLWIGTPNGLFRLARGKVEPVYINGNEPLSHILCIREDREGNLWCGTDSGLMRLLDVKIASLTVRDGLPTSSVQTMIKTRDGTVWIGTSGGGLAQMLPDGMRVYNTKTGLLNNSPGILHEDAAGGLWIGYYSKGVDCLRPDGSLEHHPEVPNIVGNIVELSPGDIWLSAVTRPGLFRLSNGAFRHIEPLKDRSVRALTRDSKGRLWAGWDGGVAILENGQWTFLDAPREMGLKNPVVFRERADGSMWLLRDNFELQRLRHGKLDRLALPEPAGRLSYGLHVRDGVAWLSMRNGLLRIKVADLEAVWDGKTTRYDYTLFNESDGMRSPAPNNASPSSILDMGPRGLWFATTKGIAIVHPDDLRTNPLPPNVVIEALVADRHDLPLAPLVRVPAGRGELTFRYTALSLGNATRILFKHRLDGFDPDWIDAQRRREANYGGIPPGTYTFRVIACNPDGVWNETGASCRITIAPHFWETWWFAALATLAALAAFSLFFAWRTRVLRSRQTTLYRQVQERTKDLLAARDTALAASKAKTGFLANMSHELRTPLNAILGYTQILRRSHNLDERQAAGLATIHESGEHLLTLIDDLLDIARIEAGKLELHPSAFNLPKFLRVVANIIRVRAEQKSIAFASEIGPDLPQTVQTDEKRLRQILLNLLGNAVKFTDHGHVTLRVKRDPAPGSARILFEIEDTGIGMTPEQLARLFQPFEQVGEGRRREGGAGLGLAISRQLVRLMGGEIEVASEPAKGSRFSFRLNLAGLDTAVAAPSDDQDITGYEGPRKKVLVVDDVAANRVVLLDAFENLGFEIHEAENGEEALALAAKVRPDLILMDITMPVLDGLEATGRLRRTPELQALPVIAVSASTSAQDRESALASGANAFLPKPVELSALTQTVGRLLGLTWTTPAPSGDIPAPPGDNGRLPLPPDEARAFHAVALRGDMAEIRAYAETLAARLPEFAPLAERIKKMSGQYQSRTLLALARQHLPAAPQRHPAATP